MQLFHNSTFKMCDVHNRETVWFISLYFVGIVILMISVIAEYLNYISTVAHKMTGVKRKLSSDADLNATRKEWEETLCPICMDHPHNAVLLRCTSHEKGCRSYICDTSYRHSNCLDRFKEIKPDRSSNVSASSSFDLNQSNPSHATNLNLEVQTGMSQVDENLNEIIVTQIPVQEVNFELEWERMERMDRGNVSLDVENLSKSKLSLSCPMCRGAVLSWDIEENARKHLNLMGRNCSQDSCSFFGNYQELRNHARKVHPSARPTRIDPLRQQAWRRLEHQREFDDVASAVRSAMPGAIVFGDYAIDSGDMIIGERANGTDEPNGPLWSTLFLFQMIESANPDANNPRARSRARAWTRHRNSTAVLSSDRRRLLWGENLLGLQHDEDDDEDEDEDDEDNVDGSDILHDISEDLPQIPRRRRRARLTRLGSDNDQS